MFFFSFFLIYKNCDKKLKKFKKIEIFSNNPKDKTRLVRHIGAIQILNILEDAADSVADCILRLINQIVEGDQQIQENLCLVGAIPAILDYTDDENEKEVRIEAAKFVKQVCSGSTLTHQMFIACRGLPHLANFLKTDDYLEDRDLVLMAIDGIQSVFELQVSNKRK